MARLLAKRSNSVLFLGNFRPEQRHCRWLNNEGRVSVEATVGGKKTTISSGKFACLADGAVVVKSGNTSLMVTAVSSTSPSSTYTILPLTVNYRERASAVHGITKNFYKKESELHPSSKEILASRLIDRSIRPLFSPGYAYDTQIISSLLEDDGLSHTGVMSINGASAALTLSDIPWNGPVAAVHVGIINGTFVSNMLSKEVLDSPLNLIISCNKEKIVMLEGYGNEISEEVICNAVQFGIKEVQSLLEVIGSLKDHSKKPLRDVELIKPSDAVKYKVHQ